MTGQEKDVVGLNSIPIARYADLVERLQTAVRQATETNQVLGMGTFMRTHPKEVASRIRHDPNAHYRECQPRLSLPYDSELDGKTCMFMHGLNWQCQWQWFRTIHAHAI